MRTIFAAAGAAALLAAAGTAHAQAPGQMSAQMSGPALRPDQQAFRGLYKELVETNTTLSAGSCTLAEERMAARLKAAGYADADITFVAPPSKPKEGSMVVRLAGSDPRQKAVLLLAHVDVVEAKREDWTRDPFTLVDEGGFYWARGSADDKAEASVWVDTMIRLKKEGYRPKRTIKMALTCGEETNGAFNGAEDLAFHHHELIDAAFALNEGGGGHMTKEGKKLTNGVMAAEKTSQNFTLTTTNGGGHSSRPTPDNAIYELTDALQKIRAYSFPIQQNEITKGQFAALGAVEGGPKGAAMLAFSRNPKDAKAIGVLRADPTYNAILHTTCVATLLSAGHATNALPQRATANVNCRIWPNTEPSVIQAELARVIGNPKVAITIPERRGPLAKPAPLSPEVMGPFAAVSEKHFPGVKIVPTMAAGATDGEFLGNANIPTYGLSGMFGTGENMGVHGLNERIAIKSLMEGRDFLFDLVKAYAPQ